MSSRNGWLKWCAACVLVGARPGWAQVELVGEGPSPVRFELVTDVDAVVPGQRLTVGIRMRHDAGWHTYWRNPGTVGLATSAAWKLPEGWTAGPLVWPRPQKTKMGVYTVWGYEGEAVLLTTIRVPDKLSATSRSQALAVDLSFMVCAQTCRPGSARLTMMLPIRAAAAAVFPWRRVFDDVRRAQARPFPHWHVVSKPSADGVRLWVTPPPGTVASTSMEFYGFTRLVSSHRPHLVRRRGARIQIDLPVEEFSPSTEARLTGVLYGITEGERRGFRIDVPWPSGADR